MKKKCAFTIVAKNYIGLAQILQKSISKHNKDVDFYIVVADEISDFSRKYPENLIIAKDCLGISCEKWIEMSFKYNLTEFCTSIKPFSFNYLFGKGYSYVIYFDPDIFQFSALTPVWEGLEDKSVMVVPHVADIHVDYEGELPEWAILSNGIFNLGFCAMRFTEYSQKLLNWWMRRLEDKCFADRARGYFTDQKWMDWLPALLGNQLIVSRNLGLNMAPWNFFERKIVKKEDGYYVESRIEKNESFDKLVFVHFAGYDYVAFKNGKIRRKRIEGLKDYEDLYGIQSDYRDAIVEERETFDYFMDQNYTYNYYENGVRINAFHRRLYNGLLEKSCLVKNPFATTQGSFYNEIKRKGMILNEKVDGFTTRNIPNMESKRKMISFLFKWLYRIAGYKKYSLFTKGLIDYYRPENHVFLLDTSKIDKR